MPDIRRRLAIGLAENPWMWGVTFGLAVGTAVVILSSALHGLHPSNALLGVVVFVGFGLIGVIGAFARRYRPGGPT